MATELSLERLHGDRNMVKNFAEETEDAAKVLADDLE